MTQIRLLQLFRAIKLDSISSSIILYIIFKLSDRQSIFSTPRRAQPLTSDAEVIPDFGYARLQTPC